MWTEEPAFPTWIFLSICWSSDSGRGDVVCVNQLDATTAAVVPQQHLCSQRQREREKRKPFDIPIGNGSVCAEREKAQDDTWKETEACLDLSLYHNWLVKEHLKLFVFHVFTQTTFLFLILRWKDVQWIHWTYLEPFLVPTGPPLTHTVPHHCSFAGIGAWQRTKIYHCEQMLMTLSSWGWKKER